MNAERFETLADAYGGDLARWPPAERAEGERWLARTPEAAAMIARARMLDQALASYDVAAPTADLQRRIIAPLLRRRATGERLRRWLSGVGVLGVLGAGAAAGAAAMALVVVAAPSRSDPEGLSPLYEQSSFGDLAAAVAAAPGGAAASGPGSARL